MYRVATRTHAKPKVTNRRLCIRDPLKCPYDISNDRVHVEPLDSSQTGRNPKGPG
jgi:hypothetical protein